MIFKAFATRISVIREDMEATRDDILDRDRPMDEDDEKIYRLESAISVLSDLEDELNG